MEPTDNVSPPAHLSDAHPAPQVTRYRVVIEEHYRTVHLIEAESQDAAEDAAYNLIGTITATSIAERTDVDVEVEPIEAD